MSEGSLDPDISSRTQRHTYLREHQGPSHCTSGVRSKKDMLEQSKDHAKISTATWATNPLLSLENPPFLYKNKRIAKEANRSWFRQTEGHGFLCMLSMPKDMVTCERLPALKSRVDKPMPEKSWIERNYIQTTKPLLLEPEGVFVGSVLLRT